MKLEHFSDLYADFISAKVNKYINFSMIDFSTNESRRLSELNYMLIAGTKKHVFQIMPNPMQCGEMCQGVLVIQACSRELFT